VKRPAGIPTQKRRLLILMHVDWNWIKQRPHFIAESLLRDARFEVLVGFIPSWRRWTLTRNPSLVRRFPLLAIPARGSRWRELINGVVGRMQLRVIERYWKPDAILVTSPRLYQYLPEQLKDRPIFYDCMDVADAFTRGAASEATRAAERGLISVVARTFVSSDYLASLLDSRGLDRSRIIVVRNGWDGMREMPDRAPRSSRPLRLAYFGTISQWLDFGALQSCLEHFDDLEIHLIGPELVTPFQHPRLVRHRPIPHHLLYQRVSVYDGFLLPFIVGDLTRGVDPVKVYEYLALGGPVLAAYYPELDQFANVVTFYRNELELQSFVRTLLENPAALSPRSVEVEPLLAGATWDRRAAAMAEAMVSAIGAVRP
jgi:teichuronic acid biosynthesis glycosyltransferase TuaH